ncbi:hypothetical protein AGR7A_pAt10101 [Agrobacterium deltaense NCPPB 1641]|uniref:Uncharacterized protein n=1 Tax=Agrobacterium deltaense NCPPB 1641 TaxID=1183425 RepID=A0A1S7U8Q8_9HYPH|nr:hypothetical protein AGR7A_pAt10101 [Agrobacterium deltaense NCPPB 1641]
MIVDFSIIGVMDSLPEVIVFPCMFGKNDHSPASLPSASHSSSGSLVIACANSAIASCVMIGSAKDREPD